ncbi:hypothetical protein B0T17DRAFT_287821 [Bombardia bombarda]|uniref:Uncharacterized protein n=1 Tax=Bombardia bombarda TaxID=252184 RepID=A0AA40C102_9PEZI|nr:hypothetical protein B0T17DRAFT_287821 [Bombardia bombarda]
MHGRQRAVTQHTTQRPKITKLLSWYLFLVSPPTPISARNFSPEISYPRSLLLQGSLSRRRHDTSDPSQTSSYLETIKPVFLSGQLKPPHMRESSLSSIRSRYHHVPRSDLCASQALTCLCLNQRNKKLVGSRV